MSPKQPLLASAASVALLSLFAAHCSIDRAASGLRPTPSGDGPPVVFDLERQPLPEIPQPNDVATFADPTSRTGRRLNVSVISPTSMETAARHGFGEMEGWGTYAPITVSFARAPGSDPTQPAIDLADVRARMQNDGHDFTNDPLYVVNLTTGVPVMLDMGDGNFPVTPRDLDAYWPNDPKAHEQNLLFETVEEGAGLTQADYRPSLDVDQDGVLDHPNSFFPLAPGGVHGVDDVLTWYERETDTLIARPLVPLEEKTEYAVVLTDRLRGPSGQPVRSPFAYVNHPAQNDSVARLLPVLSDPSRARYFGDLAGSGASHVTFAWTFTTQPVYEDLRLLRDGLYGSGPFASLATKFPATAHALQAAGMADDPSNETGSASNPLCQTPLKKPFAVYVPAAQGMLNQIVEVVLKREFTLTSSQQKILEDSLQNVDHFVIGTFTSPYFIGDDPAHEDPDDWMHLNFKTGEGRVTSDVVPFFLAVPKAQNGAAQPFPTVMWAHGTSLFAEESIVRAGYFARQGVATLAIDMPGHGLYLDENLSSLAEIVLRGNCYVEWVNALKASRAHDLNGDGVPDSGGYLWTSHIFHSRDNIRQSIVDEMQAVRMIHSFRGGLMSDQDYNGDGKSDLAGDFDGDGTPDVGGDAKVYTSGDSYGGIVAMIHGAVDPYVSAAAPISGGGGLVSDIAAHSSLVPTPVLEQIFSPLLITAPASARDSTAQLPSACGPGQVSLRFEVNDLLSTKELEIACLDPAEIASKTVVVYDIRNKQTRCARTDAQGVLRLPVAANVDDALRVQFYDGADMVDSYATCNVSPSASYGRLVDTWEVGASKLTPTFDGSSCPASGCQQFRATFYPVGSALTSPQEGVGDARQTPNVRRLFTITQAALDPGDPINFAPYYMIKHVPGLDGTPQPTRGLLVQNTVGDPYVPIATGTAFARVAGVVPFLPPSAAQTMPEYIDYVTPKPMMDAFGATPNDVLVQNHVVQGIARLGYTHAGASCGVNYQTSPAAALQCDAPPAVDTTVCAQTLFDADYASGGTNHLDAPHPAVPLRLGRLATAAKDDASLSAAWAPRIAGLDPAAQDQTAGATPMLGLVNAYINPAGAHVFAVNDPCRYFDDVTYYDTMMVRFLASGGTDVYAVTHPKTHTCMATQSCGF